jgi:hypothetical protein
MCMQWLGHYSPLPPVSLFFLPLLKKKKKTRLNFFLCPDQLSVFYHMAKKTTQHGNLNSLYVGVLNPDHDLWPPVSSFGEKESNWLSLDHMILSGPIKNGQEVGLGVEVEPRDPLLCLGSSS